MLSRSLFSLSSVLLISISLLFVTCQSETEFAFLNPNLSVEERTDDLISRMTLEAFSLSTDQGERIVEPGTFRISVGGEQPGFSGQADASTTSTVSGEVLVGG